jgi:hypothetical protein
MKFLCCIFFFVPVIFCGAQSVTFQKAIGGVRDDYGFGLTATSDEGYALTGNSNSFNTNDDIILIKLDSHAAVEWSRFYDGGGNDYGNQLVQLNDGGYGITGKTNSFGAGLFDAILMKTDSTGNFQWMKTYGGIAEERILNIRSTSDQGYLLSGSTQSFGQGNWDMLYIKTDSSGDTLWTKIIGGTDSDQGTDGEQTSDGGFIFCGRVSSSSLGYADVCLVKTDSNGDTLWTRMYGGAGWDEGMKVKQTFDGGYIVTGASTGFGNSSYDVYLIKTDGSGNLQWSKLYAGNHNDATYDIIQLADSGYVFMGETESFGNNHLLRESKTQNYFQRSASVIERGTDHSNVFIIRTDKNGDTLWTHTYGGFLLDESYTIIQLADHGFAIGGYSTSFGDSINYYLVKTDSTGHSGCFETAANPVVSIPATVEKNTVLQITSGLTVTSQAVTRITQNLIENNMCFVVTDVSAPKDMQAKIIFYPNPANSELTISGISFLKKQELFAEVLDVTGRSIFRMKLTANKTSFDISFLKSGVYLLKIDDTIQKVIKL